MMVCLLLAALGASAQKGGRQPSSPSANSRFGQIDLASEPTTDDPYHRHPDDAINLERRKMQHEMAERRNKERQQKIQADAERLVKLTSDLQLGLTASPNTPLSGGQLKQVEEIEKLARDVKKRMTGEN